MKKILIFILFMSFLGSFNDDDKKEELEYYNNVEQMLNTSYLDEEKVFPTEDQEKDENGNYIAINKDSFRVTVTRIVQSEDFGVGVELIIDNKYSEEVTFGIDENTPYHIGDDKSICVNFSVTLPPKSRCVSIIKLEGVNSIKELDFVYGGYYMLAPREYGDYKWGIDIQL